ncbi:MAG: putative acetyltransferase [Rariglobus sp.]|jgi:acetyltransferase-like isoleucine patch superfamily enzyme|nr:putative acetyltransferase [Rariglobus sp.]
MTAGPVFCMNERIKFKHFCRGLYWRARLLGKNINLDWLCKISGGASLQTSGGGGINIGARTHIASNAMLMTHGGDIEIGADCSINPFCVLYGLGGLRIGNFVRIATHTVIVPANHTFEDLQTPIHLQPESKRGIIIEDDVWIGAGCRILDGVTIGRGSVIGAGSVVTRSIPSMSVAVGVPAKVIRKRDQSAPPVTGL